MTIYKQSALTKVSWPSGNGVASLKAPQYQSSPVSIVNADGTRGTLPACHRIDIADDTGNFIVVDLTALTPDVQEIKVSPVSAIDMSKLVSQLPSDVSIQELDTLTVITNLNGQLSILLLRAKDGKEYTIQVGRVQIENTDEVPKEDHYTSYALGVKSNGDCVELTCQKPVGLIQMPGSISVSDAFALNVIGPVLQDLQVLQGHLWKIDVAQLMRRLEAAEVPIESVFRIQFSSNPLGEGVWINEVKEGEEFIPVDLSGVYKKSPDSSVIAMADHLKSQAYKTTGNLVQFADGTQGYIDSHTPTRLITQDGTTQFITLDLTEVSLETAVDVLTSSGHIINFEAFRCLMERDYPSVPLNKIKFLTLILTESGDPQMALLRVQGDDLILRSLMISESFYSKEHLDAWTVATKLELPRDLQREILVFNGTCQQAIGYSSPVLTPKKASNVSKGHTVVVYGESVTLLLRGDKRNIIFKAPIPIMNQTIRGDTSVEELKRVLGIHPKATLVRIDMNARTKQSVVTSELNKKQTTTERKELPIILVLEPTRSRPSSAVSMRSSSSHNLEGRRKVGHTRPTSARPLSRKKTSRPSHVEKPRPSTAHGRVRTTEGRTTSRPKQGTQVLRSTSAGSRTVQKRPVTAGPTLAHTTSRPKQGTTLAPRSTSVGSSVVQKRPSTAGTILGTEHTKDHQETTQRRTPEITTTATGTQQDRKGTEEIVTVSTIRENDEGNPVIITQVEDAEGSVLALTREDEDIDSPTSDEYDVMARIARLRAETAALRKTTKALGEKMESQKQDCRRLQNNMEDTAPHIV